MPVLSLIPNSKTKTKAEEVEGNKKSTKKIPSVLANQLYFRIKEWGEGGRHSVAALLPSMPKALVLSQHCKEKRNQGLQNESSMTGRLPEAFQSILRTHSDLLQLNLALEFSVGRQTQSSWTELADLTAFQCPRS